MAEDLHRNQAADRPETAGLTRAALDGCDGHKSVSAAGHSTIKMTEDYIKQRATDVVQPLRRGK